MSWEKVRLGDIAEFSNGINFGKDDYGKGIKIIGVSNFGDKFSPEYDSLTEVKEEVVKSNDYLYPGDIVFVRSNGNKELVGRCMLIDNKADKVTYSGFCIRARLKDTTKHNPTFWTYHFKNQSFRKAMAGTAVGANIQNLSQGRLADYVTTVPDYDSQVRIELIKDEQNAERRIFESDFESIFYNLIINSIEAFSKSSTKNRKIRIELKTNENLVVNYLDNGDGLDNKFKNPYEIFTLGSTSKYDQFGNVIGTGLGMYIIASTVREYNGDYKLTQIQNGFGLEIRIPL